MACLAGRRSLILPPLEEQKFVAFFVVPVTLILLCLTSFENEMKLYLAKNISVTFRYILVLKNRKVLKNFLFCFSILYLFDGVSLQFYYVLGFCIKPPVIVNARHNARPEQIAFDIDETIQYQCLSGFVTNGFPVAKCLAVEGATSWFGPDITCERKLTSAFVSIPSI